MYIVECMTIRVVDEQETEAHRLEEENLFVSCPARDAKVARCIHRVRGKLGDENSTEYVVYSFSCDGNLTNRDPT